MKLPISKRTIQPCRGSEASAIQTLLGVGARASLPFSHGKNCQQQNQLSMFKLCCHTPLCIGPHYRHEMASTPAALQAAEIVLTRSTITALIHSAIIWPTAGKMSSWKCKCKTGLMFLQGCYSKATELALQQASKMQYPMGAALKHSQCTRGWHLRKHQVGNGRAETQIFVHSTLLMWQKHDCTLVSVLQVHSS